jgi:hypothetical protein
MKSIRTRRLSSRGEESELDNKRETGEGRRAGREMMAVARWKKLVARWREGESEITPQATNQAMSR